MSTPPLSPELMQEAVAAFREHGGITLAAVALNLPRTTLQSRLNRAAEAGLLGTDPVLPGFAIKSVASKKGDAWVRQVREHGDEFEVPAGHAVRGVSALVDAEGRTIQRWVKTAREQTALDMVEVLKSAFADYRPSAAPTPPPSTPSEDLLTLIVCNDWHVNMLAWERETGANWDLRIAERVIGRGIEDAIARSPSAGTAVVLGGGDLMHADNSDARTAKSNNVLDVDGRYQKGVEVACRLMVRTIDAALRRNDQVIVRILPGNHDEHTSVAIAYFLLAWFRNEPRVEVDSDASLFWWLRFGDVMLGATHGHTVKLSALGAIMAHRRAEDWGRTKFRYCHGFHIHHASKFASEGGGVIMESHQAPIPQDAWHFGAGFLSGRSVQTITYHRAFGEVGRVRVAMLDAANDNQASDERKAA